MAIDPQVQSVQEWLNSTYGNHAQWNHVTADGATGWQTIFGLTRALQIELGIGTLSDVFGPTTMSTFTSNVGAIDKNTTNSRIVAIAQGALWCKGYQGGYSRGTFDAVTADAAAALNSDMGIGSAPKIIPKVMKSLLSMDQFRLLWSYGGTNEIREAQQWLNSTFSYRRDFPLLACDGLYGRSVQQGLMFAIQYELNMADGVANGNFGPGTKSGLRERGSLTTGSQDGARKWVRLFQAALRFNGFVSDFSGTYTNITAESARSFQSLAELPVSGNSNYQTWAGLLVSTGDETRPGAASDMSRPVTVSECSALFAAGYRTVGRYLSVLGKRIGPGELRRIHAAGLNVFPIMQEGNTSVADFSYEKGRDHGLQSVRRLMQLGFPAGTTVFYAVDFDANDDGITSRVIPYFQGVNDVVNGARFKYRVGIYGTRNVCTRVCNDGLAVEAFLASMAWGWGGNLGFTMTPNWSYDQILEYTLPGTTLGIDKNVQSRRARPVAPGQLLPTPDRDSSAFDDGYFWYLTDLCVRADIIVRGLSFSPPPASAPWTSVADDFVLGYIQAMEPNYRGGIWDSYFPVNDPPSVVDARTQFVNAAETVTPKPSQGTANFERLTHFAAALRGHTRWFASAWTRSEAQVGELTGWAGDLLNLWCQFVDYRSASGFAGSVEDWFRNHVGTTTANERFDAIDLVCDVDAYLCWERTKDGTRTISDAVREIDFESMSNAKWRYSQFVNDRFGGDLNVAAAAATNVFTSLGPGLSVPRDHFLNGRVNATASEATAIGLGFASALRDRI